MFQITILFLYIIAAACFALSRLPGLSESEGVLRAVAFISAATGLVWHTFVLWSLLVFPGGIGLSLGNTASFIGAQLALIAVIGAVEARLRGLSAGLLLLGAFAAAFTNFAHTGQSGDPVSWQMRAHILISLFAYGLLSVGAIVALFALVQDRRLSRAQLAPSNRLFAPLETNERLLNGIATGGFVVLLVAVFSGFSFVEDLFAQHLVHKTALSLLALLLFGVLLAGRRFAGWRGRRAVYLYLGGFAVLCLAYFGSRFILENVLGRSWG
ncbi:MAG: cytochrome c biogenesis protein CcsA [Gammaproteobacteria bacterium]|nr:cytochrome c biogenesis protein CcsA [Gammaproteobacteria bacterium]